MSQYWPEFLIFASAHILSLISPGPDFLMVVQSSFNYSRKSALLVALGIAIGEMVHVSYSLLCIGWLKNNSLWFFNLLKYAGAAYLLFLGVKTFFASKAQVSANELEVLDDSPALSNKKAISRGFFTNALNAKAGFFTFSFFSVLVSATTPLLVQLVYAFFILLSTFLWFSSVAIFLTHPSTRKKFLGIKHWIEAVCGLVLIVLAIKLAMQDI